MLNSNVLFISFKKPLVVKNSIPLETPASKVNTSQKLRPLREIPIKCINITKKSMPLLDVFQGKMSRSQTFQKIVQKKYRR